MLRDNFFFRNHPIPTKKPNQGKTVGIDCQDKDDAPAGGGNFADGGAPEQLVGAGSAEGGGAGLPLWVSPLELPASLKVKARIARLSEKKLLQKISFISAGMINYDRIISNIQTQTPYTDNMQQLQFLYDKKWRYNKVAIYLKFKINYLAHWLTIMQINVTT